MCDNRFRLLNINARSIVNKINQLEAELLSRSPHIAVITETWLHSAILDEDVVPPAYKIYRRDRDTRGGGVAVIFKQNIDVIPLTQCPDSECLCLKVTLSGRVFILYAVYRPPDSKPDFLTKIQNHMKEFNHHKLIIAGDFNLPGIDWKNLRSHADSSTDISSLFYIMLYNNLVQVVQQPARLPLTHAHYSILCFYIVLLSITTLLWSPEYPITKL